MKLSKTLEAIKKRIRPKPWNELDKKFKLELTCEGCGLTTNNLKTFENMLYCADCTEAETRRQRFLDEEEEWRRG